MNLTKLIARLRQVVQRPSDRELLGRIADEVGHELTRGRPEVLRQFRAEADAACRQLFESGTDPTGLEFAHGVLTALIAVAKLVDLEHQNQEDREAAQAFVRQPLFRAILESLRGTPRTTTGIAGGLNATRRRCPECSRS